MVKIKIRPCKDPDACSICLKSCPVGALMKIPVGKMKSTKHKPKRYKIKAYFADLCIRCKLCEENCPENAISIK